MLPEMSIIMTLFRPQSSIVLWCFYSGLEFFGNAYSQNYLSLQMWSCSRSYCTCCRSYIQGSVRTTPTSCESSPQSAQYQTVPKREGALANASITNCVLLPFKIARFSETTALAAARSALPFPDAGRHNGRFNSHSSQMVNCSVSRLCSRSWIVGPLCRQALLPPRGTCSLFAGWGFSR